MARYPRATWRPVTRYQPATTGSLATRMATPRRLILHTAVSSATSLFNWFNVKGRATAHFYVAHDGTVEQYIETDYRSTANLDGNPDCLTVESQDMGGPFPGWDTNGGDVPAWTDDQIEAIARLAAWAHQVHGIKLKALPSSRPGTRGIGYHRQGIDPWRDSSGEVWSKAARKVCPGDRRIAQIPTIIARARKLAAVVRPDPDGQGMTNRTSVTVPERPADDRWKPRTRLAAFTAMGERFTEWLTNDEISRRGARYKPGPSYSAYDDFNVRKIQALMGNTPDPAGRAYLGPRQWSRLFTSSRPARAKLPAELSGRTPPQLRKKQSTSRRAAPAKVPKLPAKGLFVPGEKSAAFTVMGERFLEWLTSTEVHRAGSVYTPGPRFSIYDARNIRAVQALMGNRPDPEDTAHFGPRQWERLFLEKRPAGASVPAALRRSAKRSSDTTSGAKGTAGRLIPVTGQRITVVFGKPGSWAAGRHTGVDFGSDGDDRIRAVGKGTVIVAGTQGDWGNRVIIRHPSGRYTWYCHLRSIAVKKGQKVTRGTVIGMMGETGRTFGKHLHYQESTGGYGYTTYKRPIMLGFRGY